VTAGLGALHELTAALRTAAVGRSGADALVTAARAYRAYAREHPGRYAATVAAPPGDDDEHRAAASETVDVMLAILRGWDLEGEQAIHAVRAIRSAVHGFVTLESADGFGMPVDVDESFDRLLRTLAAGLGQQRGGEAPCRLLRRLRLVRPQPAGRSDRRATRRRRGDVVGALDRGSRDPRGNLSMLLIPAVWNIPARAPDAAPVSL
jgi:hypothetical protein